MVQELTARFVSNQSERVKSKPFFKVDFLDRQPNQTEKILMIEVERIEIKDEKEREEMEEKERKIETLAQEKIIETLKIMAEHEASHLTCLNILSTMALKSLDMKETIIESIREEMNSEERRDFYVVMEAFIDLIEEKVRNIKQVRNRFLA